VVDEITSLRAYQANAKTVHAAANTIGTVLDMKA
jgi:flagellar hook protein FlgE